jgi:hypothetical protein
MSHERSLLWAFNCVMGHVAFCRSSTTTEKLQQRLADTQLLLDQFSRENELLSALNASLLSRRTLVDNDYNSECALHPSLSVLCILL